MRTRLVIAERPQVLTLPRRGRKIRFVYWDWDEVITNDKTSRTTMLRSSRRPRSQRQPRERLKREVRLGRVKHLRASQHSNNVLIFLYRGSTSKNSQPYFYQLEIFNWNSCVMWREDCVILMTVWGSSIRRLFTVFTLYKIVCQSRHNERRVEGCWAEPVCNVLDVSGWACVECWCFIFPRNTCLTLLIKT